MDWSDLRVFLAVARDGKLGAAARTLGQTQPTMGRRLRALEAAVGHPLFRRTSEGFVLTEEGGAVMRHAERMEAEALAIQRELAGQAQQLDGPLRVTCSDWFGVNLLAPALADFSRLHPRVTVELLTDARFLSLSRREADLAFRIRRFTEPDVVSMRLMHIAYGAYPRAGDPRPTRGDGAGTALIALDSAFAGAPDDSWLQTVLPNAHVALRSNNRDVQAQLCLQGAGVSVLPRPLGDRLPGLERLDLREEPPGRDTWLGYHRDLRRLARLRALVDFVVARFGA